MKGKFKTEFYTEIKNYPDGRINVFPGFSEYDQVKEFFQKYFTVDQIFGVSPYFFECFNSKNDSGFVVDVNKREIRIQNKEHLDLCEKLVLECKEKGIEFKII